MSRRSLLKGLLGSGLSPLVRVGGFSSALVACSSQDDPVVAPDPGPNWTSHARVIGLDLSDTEADYDAVLNDVVRSGATVLMAESLLGDDIGVDLFEEEVARIDYIARKARQRNLKLFWCYPSLEISTPPSPGDDYVSTATDHPDWVQKGMDGSPSVFPADASAPDGWTSVWACHNSGFRDQFFNRLKSLAATALDGLYIGVPYISDDGAMGCFNPRCVDKFRADTGLNAAGLTPNWVDPVFRTWLAWRHEEMARFCMEIVATVRSVNAGMEVVFETATMDTGGATSEGLDGAYRRFALSKPLPSSQALTLPNRIDRVWKLGSVSDDFGMRPALHDDWMCKLRAAKFARGCDGPGRSWMVSYGNLAPDAGLVMAMLVATGCNPHETKTPVNTTSVGVAFRNRMFGFLRDQTSLLFDVGPVAQVGLLHSSASRDYVDHGITNTAVYLSAVNPTTDAAIYAADPSFYRGASLGDTAFGAEYSGAFKALSHLHVPFAVVPLQTLTDADDDYLSSFALLVVPNVTCLEDAHARMLLRFTQRGGHLLVLGATPGYQDQLGLAKPDEARLDRILGFDATAGAFARDNLVYRPELLGRAYLLAEKDDAFAFFSDAVVRAGFA
ncbi:hypothetical protein AKJ09_02036 [Labilithrix luteola]|uniref:Glycoside hydrolase family 42 N-terminal domain-containing protein n=1 Tax=Labilithrix luteola TaxID=1391654 RepID=A0A0K1PPD3_9BACT|nr:hypothetical protein [Labilithrix luteola]AKU95372.1 hypothetical protein AKJ09_02036 [Labilithrix luteola]